MQHEQKECLYEKDKPLRNKVRETIHNKILTVNEVITELYKIVEDEQKRNREKNDMQDVQMEELKALIQEVASHQQITHVDIELLKVKVERLEKSVDDLNENVTNGLARKIMSEAYQNNQKQNTEMIKELTGIIKQNSSNNTETIQNQNKNNNSLLEKIFTKGGFAVAVITAIVAVIKLIAG